NERRPGGPRGSHSMREARAIPTQVPQRPIGRATVGAHPFHSRQSMSQSTPVEPQAPLNLAPTLVFILTFLAAVTLVPYWGLTHGLSIGAWVFFILFTGANGMAITG